MTVPSQPSGLQLTPETFTVAVAGGDLLVARWDAGPDAPIVLAPHGITASHRSWPHVAAALAGEITLVAPDLRGRGGSAGLPGPYGMGAHADDLVAILDHLGVERAVIAGHSMGAYVATTTAVLHPDRVRSLVLIDGGISLPTPPGLDVDQILVAVIGPAMERLSMTFPTRAAYHEMWRAHPAMADDGAWNEVTEAYIDYDLTGSEPELRSKVSADAVRADATDSLLNETTLNALDRLSCPATLVWAPRGILNQTPGLFSAEVVADLRSRLADRFDDVLVEDVNHYTLTLLPRGAAAVADVIRRHVAGRPLSA